MFASMRNKFASAPKNKRHDFVADEILKDPDFIKRLFPIYHRSKVGYGPSIEEVIRMEPVIVEGYTGADLVTYPGYGFAEPHVHFESDKEDLEREGVDEETGKNTYILAGKDYKRCHPDSSLNVMKIRDNELNYGERRRLIMTDAEEERERGRPVFSDDIKGQKIGRKAISRQKAWIERRVGSNIYI